MAWTPPPREITLTVEFPEPKPFVLDPARSLLVVVDMQNYFCKGGMNQRFFDAIEPAAELLAKARESGARVVFIQSVRSPDALEFTVFGRPLHLIEGTEDVEIVQELRPLPGETVLQKRSHDPFNHTGLDELLEREGIAPGEWTVLVAGVSAATCARAAALGFSHRDYQVLIPMDCTGASLEQEAMTYAQYRSKSYDYNMDFTLSSLVQFAPVSAEAIPVARSSRPTG